jgi:hypothetical protein
MCTYAAPDSRTILGKIDIYETLGNLNIVYLMILLVFWCSHGRLVVKNLNQNIFLPSSLLPCFSPFSHPSFFLSQLILSFEFRACGLAWNCNPLNNWDFTHHLPCLAKVLHFLM